MKRRIVLIVVILAVIIGIAAGITLYVRHNRSYRQLSRIDVAIRAGNLDRALAMTNSYIAKFPDDWQGYFQQARVQIFSGRYDEARKLLTRLRDEKDRFQPDESRVLLSLSDTYSLPAKRALASTESRMDAAAIQNWIGQLHQANEVLQQIAPADEKITVLQQQAAGLNWSEIGQAHLRLSRRYGQDEEVAATTGDEDKRKAAAKLAEAEKQQAQQAFANATEMLLAVVARDPSRDEAAATLVQLCIQQKNPAALQAARAAILSAEKPAPLAASALIVHDLETAFPDFPDSSQDDFSLEAQREKIGQAAQELDKLLALYPTELQLKLQRASLALMLQDEQLAEQYVGDILKENPRHAQARLLEAKMLLGRGRAAEAETKLFSLKAEFRDWPEAHYNYAQAVQAQGKQELARLAMRRVTELQPDHAAARRYLTASLIEDGFYQQALEDAHAYYKYYPDRPQAVEYLVTCLVRTDQPDLAREILEKVKTAHPDDPVMLLVVTGGYDLLGDTPRAVDTLRRAAESKPDALLGRMAQARALIRINREAEAEKILLDELDKDPRQHRIHFALGQMYADTGRNFQALEEYREALRLDSNNDTYRLAIARIQMETGDLEESRQMLEQISSPSTQSQLMALQLKLIQEQTLPAVPALEQIGIADRIGLAMTYLQSGQPEECIKICQTELTRKNDSIEIRTLLSQAYRALGQRDQCEEQYRILLQMGPRKLSNYLVLTRFLNDTNSPEEITKKLSVIPGAETYMIDLALGWLLEGQKNYPQAMESYRRAEKNVEAPQEVRSLATLFTARSLVSQGQIAPALELLNTIRQGEIGGDSVDFIKIGLLLQAERPAEADAIAQNLSRTAGEQRDKVLFRKLIRYYQDRQQFDQAMALTEKEEQLFPKDPEPYLLRASVLEGQNRWEEAVACYRQAKNLQPNMFAIYRSLARALNRLQQPQQALEVLAELEKSGQSGWSAAMFEKGILFEEWGLQKQAIACYEALAASGYSSNPKLQLFLGRNFAILGEKTQARQMLEKIPEYSPDYVKAQLLLAWLTEDTDAKVERLRQVQARHPQDAAAAAEMMNTLLAENRADEAVSVFSAFLQGQNRDQALPDELRLPATRAFVLASDRPAAAAASAEIAKQWSGQRSWRLLAILLYLDQQPDRAAELLTPAPESDFYDSVLGLCCAGRIKNENQIQARLTRLEELDRQAAQNPNMRPVPLLYKICIRLAAGQNDLAQAELARFQNPRSLDSTIASELVSYSLAHPNRPEVVQLLMANAALDLGIPELGRQWSLEVLQARPSCLWAAATASSFAADKAVMQKTLELLEPQDGLLAKTIEAKILLEDQEYEKAAALYGQIIAEGQDPGDLLLYQGIALENAGQLEKALEIYRKVWNETKNFMAANNAAYVITLLYPKNPEKLTEAQEMMEAVLQAMPNEPTVRDTAGWIDYLLGRCESAVQTLRWAIKQLPNSPEVHYHLGMAEQALNQTESAAWHWEAAVQIGQKMQKDGTAVTPVMADIIQKARAELDKIPAQQP
ncbi:MAG: cellulose synthase subunit BcsC [Planctomycetes bacterium ADurb.Bin412]|nr:MAG: cellulose synthase subunit BcsC [Planctomycetes bacterium ADurb.Bin412]